ncbi:MAG: hypothetical protein IAI48_01895 [Candidatus Eremiobacteraeota bacterium]|nr:hypothetical protein [Candidatus Eremiobacteraeota bacterium]
MLGIDDRGTRCSRLAFRWILRSNDERVGYGMYAGSEDPYGRIAPYVAADFAEFELDPGSYVLDVSNVRAPPSLQHEQPKLEADLDDGLFNGLPPFLMLGFVSILAALSGVTLLVASLLR